jgi:hypothetical protein
VTSFPGNRRFHGTFGCRGLPPRSVSAQLRPGRHRGEAVGENSPPPRRDSRDPRGPAPRRRGPRGRVLTPRARTSLYHRCPEPRSSSRKRRRRGGRAAHRQGSTPRYRAGHHPLPRGSTGVEAPLYPTESGRAPTSGTRRLSPASKHRPPACSGAQLRVRLRRADPGDCCPSDVLAGHTWCMNET